MSPWMMGVRQRGRRCDWRVTDQEPMMSCGLIVMGEGVHWLTAKGPHKTFVIEEWGGGPCRVMMS